MQRTQITTSKATNKRYYQDLDALHHGIFAPHSFSDLQELDDISNFQKELKEQIAFEQSVKANKKLESKILEKKIKEFKPEIDKSILELQSIKAINKLEKEEGEKIKEAFAAKNKLEVLKANVLKKKALQTKAGVIELHPLLPLENTQSENKTSSENESNDSQQVDRSKAKTIIFDKKLKNLITKPLKPIEPIFKPEKSVKNDSFELTNEVKAESKSEVKQAETKNDQFLESEQAKKPKTLATSKKPDRNHLVASDSEKALENEVLNDIVNNQFDIKISSRYLKQGVQEKQSQFNKNGKSNFETKDSKFQPLEAVNQDRTTPRTSSKTYLSSLGNEINSKFKEEFNNKQENEPEADQILQPKQEKNKVEELRERFKALTKEVYVDTKAQDEIERYEEILGQKNTAEQKSLHTPFGVPAPKKEAHIKATKLEELRAISNNKNYDKKEIEEKLKTEIELLRQIIDISESLPSLSGVTIIREMEKMVLNVLSIGNQPVNLAVLNEFGKLIEKSLQSWQKELTDVIYSYGKSSVNVDKNFTSQFQSNSENLKQSQKNQDTTQFPILNQVREQFWKKWQQNFLDHVLYPVLSLLLLNELLDDVRERENYALELYQNGQNSAKNVDWLVGLHILSQEEKKNQEVKKRVGENVDFVLERKILSEILESVRCFLKPILGLMNVGWMLFDQIELENYPIEQHQLLKNNYKNFNFGSKAFKETYQIAIKNFSYELFMSKMSDDFKLADHPGLKFAMNRDLKGALARMETLTLTYLRGCL